MSSTSITSRGAAVLTVPAQSIRNTKGADGAVENGHLRPIDLDHGVVHAAGGESGHDVLDGADPSLAVAEGRAEAGVADEVVPGGDLDGPLPTRSMRRNTMPVPPAAGSIRREARAPECRPMPTQPIADLRVRRRPVPSGKSRPLLRVLPATSVAEQESVIARSMANASQALFLHVSRISS